jgi:hypothetical protein
MSLTLKELKENLTEWPVGFNQFAYEDHDSKAPVGVDDLFGKGGIIQLEKIVSALYIPIHTYALTGQWNIVCVHASLVAVLMGNRIFKEHGPETAANTIVAIFQEMFQLEFSNTRKRATENLTQAIASKDTSLVMSCLLEEFNIQVPC